MVGLGLTTLPIATEAWGFALGALAILASSITAAYIARLRYRVLIERDATERNWRMAGQANRTFELSLQDKSANLAALFLEIARLDLEMRKAELAHEEKLALADDARPAKKAA